MKKLIFFLLTIAVFKSYGQEKQNAEVLKHEPPRFSAADSIRVDETKRKITLYGNVNLETSKLKLKADKVSIDKENNAIRAFGLKNFEFSGEVIKAAENASKYSVLKYNIGDNKVFIE